MRVIDLDHGGKVTEVPVHDRPHRGLVHRDHEGLEGQRGRDRRGRPAASDPDASSRAARARAASRASTAKRSRSTRCATSRCRSRAGDFMSIVGPSGSGKSTMLGLLGVLDLPSDGHDPHRGRRRQPRSTTRHRSTLRGDSIGFVFQQFHLIPHLTALGNVETALLYRDIRAPRAPRPRDAGARAASGSARAPTTGRCRCRVASSSASRSRARS